VRGRILRRLFLDRLRLVILGFALTISIALAAEGYFTVLDGVYIWNPPHVLADNVKGLRCS
jgi:hypothetical protein